MAAPSGIVWGSKVNNEGRIGIYTSISNTNTQTTVTVQIWFGSRYSVSDSNNDLYYTNSASSSSAKDNKGSVAVKTTVSSGSGWSGTNEIKLYEYTHTYTRGTSSATRYLYAKLTNIDVVGAAMYASKTITIPAKPSYIVAYNANGGSGAPSSQTKWYGTAITLSGAKPTRTGYSFQGWGTSASDTSVDYAAGASYTANAGITLYAIWKANTYTIAYNANGGSGAPSSQTKTHGVALTLSSTKPTRTNYRFLGWATSASATTAAYSAGGSYNTNANTTLYAVWELAYKKPTISNLSANRCNSSGTLSDDGTYALIAFKWSTFQTVVSIYVSWSDASGSETGSATISASGTSGTVSQVVGNGSFNTELSYSFTVVVADGSSDNYKTDRTTPMSGMEFHMDFGENSVAIGKPAEQIYDENGNEIKAFDVKWRSRFRENICVGEKTGYQDGKQGSYLTWEGFLHLQRTTAQGYHPYIGFYLDDATSAAGTIRLNSSTKLMEFLNAGGYHFGSGIYMDNNEAIMGYDSSGAAVNAFQAKNDSDNTIVGYGNYANKSGNTNIYGYDINFGVANIATPGSYRPYRRRGDSITYSLRTAGYVTNAGTEVWFTVPFTVPVVGSPTINASSVNGFILRQDNNYTHGSAASTYAIPTSYTAYNYQWCGIAIKAVFSTTTNVVNNAPIGIFWNGTITFS